MPYPQKGESRKDYVNRAMPLFKDEGYSQEEAIGRAYGFYKHYTKKGKTKKKKALDWDTPGHEADKELKKRGY